MDPIRCFNFKGIRIGTFIEPTSIIIIHRCNELALMNEILYMERKLTITKVRRAISHATFARRAFFFFKKKKNQVLKFS